MKKIQLLLLSFTLTQMCIAQIIINNHLSNNQLPAHIERHPDKSGIYAIFPDSDIWKDLFKNWLAAKGFLPAKM